MANCTSCGKRISFLDIGNSGICLRCETSLLEQARISDKARIESEKAQQEAATAELQEKMDTILLTTETTLAYTNIQRLAIVSAECVFGMNVLKDVLSSGRDFFGGRSAVLQNGLRDARQTALLELKREAAEIDANAVIAVSLNYQHMGSSSMLMLVATGTAVKLDLEGLATFSARHGHSH